MKTSLKITALTLALIICCASICSCEFLPIIPTPDKLLNLDGYELVIFDDFEGDKLDLDVWEYRLSGKRRAGFNHPDQVSVRDGNLVITGEYTENKYGEGWYAGMIMTKDRFVGGYFEIKCKANASEDFFSAFWMTCDHPYDHEISNGGIGGAEIDVFETYSEHTFKTTNFIKTHIFCNGTDDDVENIDSHMVTKRYVSGLTTEYNTFGVKWTEEEYIFYVNGVETGRTSFGKGVSQVPEYVVVSLELPFEFSIDKSVKTEYLVDYVKIYQLKDK